MNVINIIKNAYELFGNMVDAPPSNKPKGEKVYDKVAVKMLEELSYGVYRNDYTLDEVNIEIIKIIEKIKEGTKIF